MRQNLVKQAENILQQRKLNAEHAFNALMQPVYSDKDFEKLEKEKTKLTIENAKLEADGQKPDRKKLREIENKIEKIKEKYGLKDEKIAYGCKICHDNGYIDGQMCKCLKKEISKILLEESGFTNLETFESAIKTCEPEQTMTYEKMERWCTKDSKYNLIYLYGNVGSGKTFLTKCMANKFIEDGKVIKLVTAFNMNQDFKEFKKTMNEDLLNKYLSPEVLFVDDLGTETKYKDVTIEYLYLVINERKMKNLKTIITSNLHPDNLLNQYDERICSRIFNYNSSLVFEMNSSFDQRLKK